MIDITKINIYLALLDDVPRIPDVIFEIAKSNYDELIVVPMLVANSTHTDEIAGQIEDAEHLIRLAGVFSALGIAAPPTVRGANA